jgi:hypothetical protein
MRLDIKTYTHNPNLDAAFIIGLISILFYDCFNVEKNVHLPVYISLSVYLCIPMLIMFITHTLSLTRLDALYHSLTLTPSSHSLYILMFSSLCVSPSHSFFLHSYVFLFVCVSLYFTHSLSHFFFLHSYVFSLALSLSLSHTQTHTLSLTSFIPMFLSLSFSLHNTQTEIFQYQYSRVHRSFSLTHS